MQTQKMAIRILMAATHHPPTATTPQGKAFHPPRLAKIAKQTSVWWKAALLSGVL
jgi:hypothetical protein